MKQKNSIYKPKKEEDTLSFVAESKGVYLALSSDERKRKLELLEQIHKIAEKSKYKVPKNYKRAYHIHLRKKYG